MGKKIIQKYYKKKGDNMKKISAIILALVCTISSIAAFPVSAKAGTKSITSEVEFTAHYADFKAKTTFKYDAKSNKMVCNKGQYGITSITLKNIPYMNNVGYNGGLYKGSGSPLKSSSYTHKEWLNDNLYKLGIGGSAQEFQLAMAASYVLGKTISPATIKLPINFGNNTKHEYTINYINQNYPDRILGNLKMGRPVLVCVSDRGNNCPFTDGSSMILLYGVDKKNNCKILNSNDYFYLDKNYKFKDGTSRRQTSCIKGYSDKLTWPWATIKKYYQWAAYVEGPTSQKIRAELDKWVELRTKRINQTYTIKYNLNGGKVSGNPTKFKYTTKTFKLKAPTRKGYTFLGWIVPGNSTPRKAITIQQFTANKNLSFTAKWKKA